MPASMEFVDVFSLDSEMLGMLPRPAFAMILAYSDKEIAPSGKPPK
jgi:hypothetical protein